MKSIQHLLLLLLLVISMQAKAQNKTENVILITLDGFRWEELFGGAVDTLMNDLTFVKDTAALRKQFWAATPTERRQILMPWIWSEVGTKGQIYGNRQFGNKVTCTNPHWFSYPGYNEILTGKSDPYVDSNDKKYNSNETVLEWLNKKPEFKGKVAAFTSWDVFPYIINDKRSGIPVNGGYGDAIDKNLSEREKLLNELQDKVPSPWSSVRYDGFTQEFAMEYINKHHPRVIYISLGETDDFAHDGKYDRYLQSALLSDKLIQELWETLQKDPFYAGKTTLLMSTDHGRGSSPKAEWKSHGKIYKGSPFIWMAALGPDTPALGEVKTEEQLFQNQVAPTLAALLGFHFDNHPEVGEPIKSICPNAIMH